MKTRSLLLLIVFLGSLMPFSSVSAADHPQRDFDDSLSLLYASRAILINEEDLSATSSTPGLMVPPDPSIRADARDTALSNLIQATKDQRNALDASCNQLKNIYAASGKTCERQVLVSYCDTQRDKLNTRLGYLHSLRGDQRKVLTRLWHSVKRSSENLWHAVGPVGRRLLRRVGPEVAEIVLSGGTLSGGVLRKIVYKEARSVGKGELERLLTRGVEKFLVSQAALAQAAGVVDCTAEKMEEARQQVAGDVGEPEIQSQPDGKTSCEPNWWNTAYWEQNILPELQASDKRCGSFGNYQGCLSERALEGDCPEEAVANCASVYDQILSTSSGKIVKIVDDQLQSHDNDNHFDITFSMNGGPVSGSVLIDFQTDYGDGDYCRVIVAKTITGSFDPGTCTLTGTAEAIQTHEESRNDICWGEPYERIENWTMVIRNGVLSSGDGLVSGGVTYGIK